MRETSHFTFIFLTLRLYKLMETPLGGGAPSNNTLSEAHVQYKWKTQGAFVFRGLSEILDMAATWLTSHIFILDPRQVFFFVYKIKTHSAQPNFFFMS